MREGASPYATGSRLPKVACHYPGNRPRRRPRSLGVEIPAPSGCFEDEDDDEDEKTDSPEVGGWASGAGCGSRRHRRTALLWVDPRRRD